MDIGEALAAMKAGREITRESWPDGAGLWIHGGTVYQRGDTPLREMGVMPFEDLMAMDWVIAVRAEPEPGPVQGTAAPY